MFLIQSLLTQGREVTSDTTHNTPLVSVFRTLRQERRL